MLKLILATSFEGLIVVGAGSVHAWWDENDGGWKISMQTMPPPCMGTPISPVKTGKTEGGKAGVCHGAMTAAVGAQGYGIFQRPDGRNRDGYQHQG